MATLPGPQPDPGLIFETFNAHQRTAALKAAIELGLFRAAGQGDATAASLAARCEASERGVRILCDFLTIDGFLEKRGDAYSLAPVSAVFLDPRSPAYLGSLSKFLASPFSLEHYQHLAETVRKGGETAQMSSVRRENEEWVEFARSMAPMMAPVAEAIARQTAAANPVKVLDIAAGHGLFGIAIARQHADAHVYALDWPVVLEVARENAAKADLGDRYHTIEGSAFDAEFGSDYDLVLITNFLHHFDPPTCETFLRKVHAALKPGGRAVTLEMVPNEDRISPPIAAAFSLIMLATTERGDAYTFAELDRMLRNAGFERNHFHPLPVGPEALVVSEK